MSDPVSSKDLLGIFGINAKLFIAQLVNFTIVLLVMWRWVYRPLVAMMEKRTKEISEGLARGQEAERVLAEAAMERERILREANAKTREIIDAARAESEVLRAKKMALAKTEIEKLVDEAKARIHLERTNAFDALKQDVASLVTLAMQKIVGNFDEKKQRSLIAEAIKEIGSQ